MEQTALFFLAIGDGETSALPPPPELPHGVLHLSDARHASLALGSYVNAVVLVQFSTQTKGSDLDTLEQLISEHHHCAWIALVPRQWQQQEQLGGLITRTFFDYHQLPPSPERLGIIIGHAFGMLALQRRVDELTTPEHDDFHLVGDSPPIRRLKKALSKVADNHNTVLINGESGTGKELAARAIHQHSPRKEGPFEAINCAAIPHNLIQAELFGSEKGAYTDAHARKIGRFEACHGGTLFLDEIGDMPLDQQVNLLRVLEQGALRRIGGNRDIPVDVRIVAATHINLEEAVRQGRFREDLFYRLNVLRLEMPPLRERDGDIELLARHFFRRLRQPGRSGPKGFSNEAIEAMLQHSWPGNVRELINRVQQAIVMADGPLILPHDLGIERRENRRRRISLEQARNEAESRAINDALHLHLHNLSEAARELGISRVTLYRLMAKHGIASH